MRFVIDCRMLQCSGIGTFLDGVVKEIINCRDISFILIGDKQRLSIYRQDNVEFIPCKIPIFSVQELYGFPTSEINKCDCFFTPNYNIPPGIKIPIFSTIHDVLFLDFPDLKWFVGRLIRKLAIDRAIKLSTHIFTVSEFSKSRILYHSHRVKSISVCYNGADNILGGSIEKPSVYIDGEYYIYVGNIKPHKGLNVLLEAIEQPPIRRLNRKLVIVGNQKSFKTADTVITKRLAELSKFGKIIFTGYVDKSDLVNLIKGAYCLIQPSEYEGFGLPPLEALQLGTPVIVSDIPVFKELYMDFPVVYFKAGDPCSLAAAMNLPFPRIKLNSTLRNKYTYKRTADIILSDIKSHLQ